MDDGIYVVSMFCAMMGLVFGIVGGCWSKESMYKCDVCGEDVTVVSDHFKKIEKPGGRILYCEKCWKKMKDEASKEGGAE